MEIYFIMKMVRYILKENIKLVTLLFKNGLLKRWYAKKVDVVGKLNLISFDCQWIWWGRNFDKEFGNKRKKLWNWLA